MNEILEEPFTVQRCRLLELSIDQIKFASLKRCYSWQCQLGIQADGDKAAAAELHWLQTVLLLGTK